MYFGLSKPLVAKYNPGGTYSDGFRCGQAVGTNINPNYAEGKFHADNVLSEHVKKFRDADVGLETKTLPKEGETIMFGRTVDKTTGLVTYNRDDKSNYVGYGFIVTEINDGLESYMAVFLPKCKFEAGAEEYVTRGENIEFKTPKISGKAYPIDDGDWRYKQPCETYKKAEEWLMKKLNITAPPAEPK